MAQLRTKAAREKAQTFEDMRLVTLLLAQKWTTAGRTAAKDLKRDTRELALSNHVIVPPLLVSGNASLSPDQPFKLV